MKTKFRWFYKAKKTQAVGRDCNIFAGVPQNPEDQLVATGSAGSLFASEEAANVHLTSSRILIYGRLRCRERSQSCDIQYWSILTNFMWITWHDWSIATHDMSLLWVILLPFFNIARRCINCLSFVAFLCSDFGCRMFKMLPLQAPNSSSTIHVRPFDSLVVGCSPQDDDSCKMKVTRSGSTRKHRWFSPHQLRCVWGEGGNVRFMPEVGWWMWRLFWAVQFWLWTCQEEEFSSWC